MAESSISFEELYDRVVDDVAARGAKGLTPELEERLRSLFVVLYPDLAQRDDIVRSLREVLTYLTTRKGRTDANCWVTDLFVYRLFDVVEYEIPDGDVYDILRDVMMALHDTVSAPRIAANVWSTPEQLLERLHALPK